MSAALATSVAALAVTAAPALAVDEIAYRCDGEADICLMNPESPSAITNLTDNGSAAYEEHPTWSPDGSRLAFESTFAGSQNIFVMRPDSGEASNLAVQVTHYTEPTGGITDLAWSRDGTRIAFAHKISYPADYGVFTAAADGSSATPRTIAAEGEHPTWAPDGLRLAYSKGQQVYLVNSDGTGTAPLPGGTGHSPNWSPDGVQIAFDQINPEQHDPFVDLRMVAGGCGASPVSVPLSYSQFSFAEWSPDGSKLAYRADNDGNLSVIGRYGGAATPLATATGVAMPTPPSWSPDGLRVVFSAHWYVSPGGTGNEGEDVYMENTNGSGSLQKLTTGGRNYYAVWRPDPLRTPFVPIVCHSPAPAPGSPGPTPEATRKPTIVWITKRIPWTPGRPIFMASYGCGGLTCAVVTQGTARYAAPILPRAAGFALLAKPKHGKNKPKPIVVGRGKMTVPGGATRPLTMKLTAKGIGLLKKLGKLTIDVTVTTTVPGSPKVVQKKKIQVYVKPAKGKH
ncbi:MAG: PD40 domain-containing protein [Solirubrobacterales bacterium]|nr:PD40 domain-containing protein [Solirubrobacterales bacterium]